MTIEKYEELVELRTEISRTHDVIDAITNSNCRHINSLAAIKKDGTGISIISDSKLSEKLQDRLLKAANAYLAELEQRFENA